MAASEQSPLKDVQQVLRLVGEIRRLRGDPDRQRKRTKAALRVLRGRTTSLARTYGQPPTRRLTWFLNWIGEPPAPAAEESEHWRRGSRRAKLLRLFVTELYRLHRAGGLGEGRGGGGEGGVLEGAMRSLPPRRRQVLDAILQGQSSKQIAWVAGISRRTVDDHLRALYQQFNVRDRTELLARFIPQNDRPVAPGPPMQDPSRVPGAAPADAQKANPLSRPGAGGATMHPASRRQRLRLREIRAVYRILDEARELGGRGYAARRHIAFELCRLVHARQSFYACFDGFTPWDALCVQDMIVGGWPDEQALRSFQTWATRGMLREDPLVRSTSSSPSRRATLLREQIASDRQWRSSKVYESLAEPNDVDDMIVAYFRPREPGRAVSFTVQRGRDERRFTRRERRLMQLFNDEFHRRYLSSEADVAGQDTSPSPLLAPRQCQVLEAMLRGESTKQVAERLGLSRRTLEEYGHALYKKFGVESRFELMAYFARPT